MFNKNRFLKQVRYQTEKISFVAELLWSRSLAVFNQQAWCHLLFPYAATASVYACSCVRDRHGLRKCRTCQQQHALAVQDVDTTHNIRQ